MKGCLIVLVVLLLAAGVCALSSGAGQPLTDHEDWYLGPVERTGACFIGPNGIYVKAWDLEHRMSYYEAKRIPGHPCGAMDGFWGSYAYEMVGEPWRAPVYDAGPFLLFK